MIYSDSLVRVWNGAGFDSERFLLIERLDDAWCVLEFCDLALPEGERCFVTIPCQAHLLAKAADGATCGLADGDASCTITPEGSIVRIEFRGAGFLIPNEWNVLATELRTAAEFVS